MALLCFMQCDMRFREKEVCSEGKWNTSFHCLILWLKKRDVCVLFFYTTQPNGCYKSLSRQGGVICRLIITIAESEWTVSYCSNIINWSPILFKDFPHFKEDKNNPRTFVGNQYLINKLKSWLIWLILYSHHPRNIYECFFLSLKSIFIACFMSLCV